MKINLNIGNYHKVKLDGKWASAININGSRKWTEESAPTRLDNMVTYLPMNDWGSRSIEPEGSALRDVRKKAYWKMANDGLKLGRYKGKSGTTRNMPNLSNGPSMTIGNSSFSTSVDAAKYSFMWEVISDRFDSPCAYSASWHSPNTAPALGPNYTLSMWAYVDRTRPNTSKFMYNIVQDPSHFYASKNGVRIFENSGRMFWFDQYTHRFEIFSGSGNAGIFIRTRGGIDGKVNYFGHPEAASDPHNYWGANLPSEWLPNRTWTHVLVSVVGSNFTFAFAPVGNGKLDFSKFYVTIPYTFTKKNGTGAPRLQLNPACASCRKAQSVGINGNGVQVSHFRVYNTALGAGSNANANIINHRDLYGDLTTSTAADFNRSFDDAIDSDIQNDSSYLAEYDLENSFRNYLIEGKNKNIGDADMKSYISDFDDTHDTSYSEMVSEKEDIQEGIYEQTKNAQLQENSLEFKTREIQDIGI